MKKVTLLISTMLLAVTSAGCSVGSKIPKEWYKESIEYFRDGISKGWDQADPEKYHVKETVRVSAYVVGADGERKDGVTVSSGPEEYADDSNRFGYLLKDLDGDGAQELLVGLINDSPETQFMDLCVWNSDFGATHVLSCGDGDYLYLCDDGTLIQESSFGGESEEYMKYSSETNSFEIIENDGTKRAGRYELTPFE